MNLTRRTTDEELLALVAAARETLVEIATKGSDSHTLAQAVNAVAEMEGRVEVRALVVHALRHEADEQQIRQSLLQRLLQSPNDTWSGRTNDARRARMDGVREEIEHMLGFRTLANLMAADNVNEIALAIHGEPEQEVQS